MATPQPITKANQFIALISRLPWWMCLLLAAASYGGLHFFAQRALPPILSSSQLDSFAAQAMWRALADIGQYMLPFVFLMLSMVSALQRRYAVRAEPPTSALLGESDLPESSADTGGAFRCPLCSAPMALKVVRTGPMIGKRFWGCGQYALTQCRGTRELD